MSKVLLLRTTKTMSFYLVKKFSKKYQSPFAPPIFLLYLASVLEKEGHIVNLIDFTCEENPEDKIRHLLLSTDAVVISVYPGNEKESRFLTYLVRKNCHEIPIIIQGLYCTINPGKALQEIPLADICIEGEGDYIINDVIEAIAGKRLLSEIPGIHYRVKNQIKVRNNIRKIKNLDALPFPARHLVKKYKYGLINGIHLCKPLFTSILTSRGCPSCCRFCTNHFINGIFNQRSPENVLQEFHKIQDEYSSVMIADDNFLTNPQRVHKIMDGLIQSGSELELFIAGARVDTADRELYSKMAKAGVKIISFGIESGNQDVLDYYSKKITLSQIMKAINIACEMRIITWGNFIFGAPIETKEHLKNTMNFSLSLPLDIAIYRQLSYQRGSELWKEAVSNGLIEEDISFCYAGSGKTATNFTSEELSAYCRLAYKRFYYRPSYLLQEFFRSVIRKDFTILKSLYSVI